ncbi:MAG: AmmeMemoRadiSam system protein A [Myxococcales bacterium]|nr:AmmeMemoRadiSam system protein A [Myxococcales bacterium]
MRSNPSQPAAVGRAALSEARDAIATAVGAPRRLDAPQYEAERRANAASLSTPSQGVFVTLRDAKGDLRGCVGHVEPAHSSLLEEVRACARAAATQDPRFSPVPADDLSGLTLEVSLLSEPERVADPNDLDPGRFGVVVADGRRRGVLLPNIDGVDTADQQVAIAARKAGFTPGPTTVVHRFEVNKYSE